MMCRNEESQASYRYESVWDASSRLNSNIQFGTEQFLSNPILKQCNKNGCERCQRDRRFIEWL